MEYELNTEQCINVAQYMYKMYEEAMSPPLYRWLSFPDWLHEIKQRNVTNKLTQDIAKSHKRVQKLKEVLDKCEICGAEPMTTNCNNAGCDD